MDFLPVDLRCHPLRIGGGELPAGDFGQNLNEVRHSPKASYIFSVQEPFLGQAGKLHPKEGPYSLYDALRVLGRNRYPDIHVACRPNVSVVSYRVATDDKILNASFV